MASPHRRLLLSTIFYQFSPHSDVSSLLLECRYVMVWSYWNLLRVKKTRNWMFIFKPQKLHWVPLKANAKKWVAFWTVNSGQFSDSGPGRLFPRLGAATAKALSLFDFSQHLGTSSSTCRADRNSLTGAWMQYQTNYTGNIEQKSVTEPLSVTPVSLQRTPVISNSLPWVPLCFAMFWSYPSNMIQTKYNIH